MMGCTAGHTQDKTCLFVALGTVMHVRLSEGERPRESFVLLVQGLLTQVINDGRCFKRLMPMQ